MRERYLREKEETAISHGTEQVGIGMYNVRPARAMHGTSMVTTSLNAATEGDFE